MANHGRSSATHKKSSPRLAFERMDEMIDAYSEATKGATPSRTESYAFVAGVMGTLLALVASVASPRFLASGWAVAGVLLELGAFSLFLVLFFKREWRNFRNNRRDYAKDLDRDYAKYVAYVRQLRQYPRSQRDELLRYIQARRKVMHYRMGLITGGMERLGVLPLLAALYFQLKDWRFGDWTALGEVTLTQGLIALALLVLYVGSWQLIHLYTRTESYELLLAEAAARDD